MSGDRAGQLVHACTTWSHDTNFASFVITQVQWQFSTARTNSLIQVRANKSTVEHQLEHATADLCMHQAGIHPKETDLDESHTILEPDLFCWSFV